MAGIKPTRIQPAQGLTTMESAPGVFTGDDAEFPTSPISGSPAANDQWKQPVRVATTANVAIATGLEAGDTIDGVTLVAGDRVLVKDQADATENGIYVASITGAASRAPDMDSPDEVVGAIVRVTLGTVNAGSVWVADNTTAPDFGVDDITFTEFASAGDFVLKNEGGQDTVNAIGSVTGAANIDPSSGNVFTATLTGNTTATILTPVGTGASTLEGWITQDGTGGRVLTFAASGAGTFAWDGGLTPTPDTTAGVTVRYVLERVPGTTDDWIGDLVGGGSSGSSTTVGAHAHVVSESHLSNGSSTTYTLDQYYEPGSVIAWNTTTIARLGVIEVVPDQATVSAAGSSGDTIMFDYAATLV